MAAAVAVGAALAPTQGHAQASPGPRVVFPELRTSLKDAPPVLRDSQLDVNFRSFYFNREPVNDRTSEALAAGGWLGFKSGWYEDTLSVGATVYTSQAVYGPSGRDGTLLLAPGQDSYTVLGEIYGKVKLFDDEIVTAGRSLFDTPYINRNDVRMTPNTFQNYTLSGGAKFGGDVSLKYDAGYVEKIKERNGTNFKWMSKSAGANIEHGTTVAGGTLSVGKFAFTAYEYYTSDVLNIGYGEAKYALAFDGGYSGSVAAQYTDQRSVGDDLLTGASYKTGQAGLKGEMSNWGLTLTLAYTDAQDDANMRNPWSGYPGYTSVQVQDFNRAGEKAFLGKVGYDLSRIGLTGLTTYALFVSGSTDSRAAGTADIDEYEADFDLTWNVPWEALRGLSLRGRYAFVTIDQTTSRGNINDARLIMNYAFKLY